MSAAHQFSQLPIAYYTQLKFKNRRKAIAFLEFTVDYMTDNPVSDREYGRKWDLKSSASSRDWCQDFRSAIGDYRRARINFSNKINEKSNQKKPKISQTAVKQKAKAYQTPEIIEDTEDEQIQYSAANSIKSGDKGMPNAFTIDKNLELNYIGGDEVHSYIEFRLSDHSVNNPKGLKISILRDLENQESREYKDFSEWKQIQLESSYQLERMIGEFSNFGNIDRKLCREIKEMFEQEIGAEIHHFIFDIAFYEAKKIIFQRKSRNVF